MIPGALVPWCPSLHASAEGTGLTLGRASVDNNMSAYITARTFQISRPRTKQSPV